MPVGDPIPSSDKKPVLLCPLPTQMLGVNERLSIIEKPGADAVVEYASYKHGEMSLRQLSALYVLAVLRELQPRKPTQHILIALPITAVVFQTSRAERRGRRQKREGLPSPWPHIRPESERLTWPRSEKMMWSRTRIPRSSPAFTTARGSANADHFSTVILSASKLTQRYPSVRRPSISSV